MKRPSFQFYPEAWQTNANLKRCAKSLKCTWLDVMILLHDSEEEYGILRWPLREVAKAAPCKLSELVELRSKGVLKGADIGESCKAFIYTPRHAGKDGTPIVLIPEQSGPIWYSSRMVRDEYIRSKRGIGTRFGEDPEATEPSPKKTPTRTPTQRQGEPPIQREGDGPLALALSLVSESSTSTPLSGSPPDALTLTADSTPKKLNGSAFHPDAEDVLGYLNKSAGKGYKFRTPKGELTASANRIIARLKEGYTRGDLREVVHAKCEQWRDDDHMAEYLRPITLFGKEKFEQYLGELKGAGNG